MLQPLFFNGSLFHLILPVLLILVKIVRNLAIVLIRACNLKLLFNLFHRLIFKYGLPHIFFDEIFTLSRWEVMNFIRARYLFFMLRKNVLDVLLSRSLASLRF